MEIQEENILGSRRRGRKRKSSDLKSNSGRKEEEIQEEKKRRCGSSAAKIPGSRRGRKRKIPDLEPNSGRKEEEEIHEENKRRCWLSSISSRGRKRNNSPNFYFLEQSKLLWKGFIREEHNRLLREKFIWKDIVRVDEKDVSKRRRWEEMDGDVLVNIMQRVLQKERDHSDFHFLSICRSWSAAVLDVYFPYGHNIFDLSPYGELDTTYLAMGFLICMKLGLHLRPTTHYSKMVLGKYQIFYNKKFMLRKSPSIFELFERLPLLQQIESSAHQILLCGGQSDYGLRLAPYYKNLEAVYCSPIMMPTFGYHSKCMHTLHLYGLIEDRKASFIGSNFPLLKHLKIPSCALSVNALPMILDGHKNLVALNTEHCFLLDCLDKFPCFGLFFDQSSDAEVPSQVKAMEWKEEEMFQNNTAHGGLMHLQCRRRYCSKCSYLYK